MTLDILFVELDCCLGVFQGVLELSQLLEASRSVGIEHTLSVVLSDGLAVAFNGCLEIVLFEDEVALLFPIVC